MREVAIQVMQEPAKNDDTGQRQPQAFGQMRMEWYSDKRTFEVAIDCKVTALG